MKNENKKPGKFPYALIVAAVLLIADFVIGYSIQPCCAPPFPLTLSEFAVIFAIIAIVVVIILVLYGPRPLNKISISEATAQKKLGR